MGSCKKCFCKRRIRTNCVSSAAPRNSICYVGMQMMGCGTGNCVSSNGCNWGGSSKCKKKRRC